MIKGNFIFKPKGDSTESPMRAHASLRNISSISAQWQGSTSNENQEGAYIWETSLGTRRCLDTKLLLGVYIFLKNHSQPYCKSC